VLLLVLLAPALTHWSAAQAKTPRQHSVTLHWVGAWEGSPESGGAMSEDQSYRLFVHASTGGPSLRLRFSNRYGRTPLSLRDVTVALPITPLTPAVQAATVRPVRFAKGNSLTIAPGEDAISAAVHLRLAGSSWLAVSFFAPGSYPTTTYHQDAWGLNWQTLAGDGDHAGDASGKSFRRPYDSWTFLSGVDVLAPTTVSTVVALGDSITDCVASVPDGNTRWPDLLNDRLAAMPGGQHFSVVNAGIGGNLVSKDRDGNANVGQAADKRMRWDVFDEPDVSTLILFEGVNDIGKGVTAAGLERAYRQILLAAHQRGIRVLISTLTPTAGKVSNEHMDYATLAGTRDQVDHWIADHRSSFDGVLHFGEVVEDPLAPQTWNPAYSAGDQTHPNPLGLKVMADSIPLSLFRH
jgi:lysophospholipase L1-like esterase